MEKDFLRAIERATTHIGNKQYKRAVDSLVHFSTFTQNVEHTTLGTLFKFHVVLSRALLLNKERDRLRSLWRATKQQIVAEGNVVDADMLASIAYFHCNAYYVLHDIQERAEALYQASFAMGLGAHFDIMIQFTSTLINLSRFEDAFKCMARYCCTREVDTSQRKRILGRMILIEQKKDMHPHLDLVYEVIFELMRPDDMQEYRSWFIEACMRTKNFPSLSFLKDDPQVITLSTQLACDSLAWKPLIKKSETWRPLTKVRMCAACGKFQYKMQKCSECLLFHFCSQECNEKGWEQHKKCCLRIREMKSGFL